MWGELAERYGDATSPVLREVVGKALRKRAELLAAIGQRAEAVVLTDALIARVGDGDDPEQLSLLADGLATKGAALVGEGRHEEGIMVLDQLIGRFEDANDPELRIQVALALRNKEVALLQLGRAEEAQSVHDDMVTRFGEDALAGFDEIGRRYAQADEPQMRELLVSMLHGKAMLLSDLGRQDEAVPVLTELIARFDDDVNTNIQMIVADSREVRERMLAGGGGPV